MAACRALDCLKPAGRRPFCRECLKALQPGEVWILSIAYLSPFYASLGSWPIVDGSERMRVHFEEDGLPCWTTTAGVGPIAAVLEWLEYELAIVACAGALTARRKAKADKARLAALRRVTGHRR
jgi:hypothetical protein